MPNNLNNEYQRTLERYNQFLNSKDNLKVRLVTNSVKLTMGTISGLALAMVIAGFYNAYKLAGKLILVNEETFLWFKKVGKITGVTELVVFGVIYGLFFKVNPLMTLHGLTYALVFLLAITLSLSGVALLGLRLSCENFQQAFKH